MVLVVVPVMGVDRSILPPKRILGLLPLGSYSNMSTTNTKQYAPTATARPTWRDREAQKHRQEREAALKAAEDARIQSFANTEENFPSLVKPADKITVHGGPPGKFAELANSLQREEAVYQKEETVPSTPTAYHKKKQFQRADDEGESYVYVRDEEMTVNVDEPKESLYPTHGKRGTCSEPDSEGWRTVTKRVKKQKRPLTEAELVKKYREEFFGEGEEEEVNAEIAETSQRRDFY
jgi:hypothetical protein